MPCDMHAAPTIRESAILDRVCRKLVNCHRKQESIVGLDDSGAAIYGEPLSVIFEEWFESAG